ncbi:MAG: LytTR family DNA-binding domain-containing protein [Crocinitomicaceae bacterium]|nr:LytTR family DNA-binding domain-containing protein [Crocinitomicaceae bacterium]
MKIVIIEDELPAARRLEKLILELDPEAEIIARIQEVAEAIVWFGQNPHPDIVFMDVQLADGYSFEIFESTEINSSIIFATAYDQYALKAFKVNGLDYLLKPINKADLENAIRRYKDLELSKNIDFEKVKALFQPKEKSYKDRFMVKSGDQLNFVKSTDVAYFISEGSYSFLVSKLGNRFILDDTMDHIESQLNPNNFFRVSRKKIISIDAISSVHSHFNSRLKVVLTPEDSQETIVSRPRVKEFKEWLDK